MVGLSIQLPGGPAQAGTFRLGAGKALGLYLDDAALQTAGSSFAAVMYIRVRFAEYSFGLAAVAALVHDVLITLGALSLAMASGLIQV